MATRYGKHFQARQTPQSEPIPGRAMVPNSAGGFVFAIDDWSRLDRWLILGGDGGTYYASERKITIENAECVKRCLAADAKRTVETIARVSESGRAPKNAPAVFALAIAAGLGHLSEVSSADALRRVCRTPTDLFAFVEAVDGLRGWGRGLRKLVAAWYTGKSADQLGYQVTKYRQRDGWTHRDVLRLAHPVTDSAAHQALYRWAVAGGDSLGDRSVERRVAQPVGEASKVTKVYEPVGSLPSIVEAFQEAQAATDKSVVVRLIREAGLVREHIPTQWLNDPEVWAALLDKMPLTAMVRNLGKMTAVGLLAPLSKASRVVADRLGDADYLRKSRVHPIAVLLAAKVYAQGHGDKGKLAWSPVSTINDALDAAFYKAFANVVPAGKRTLLALDVSGSMMMPIAGTSLSCREASAALAMVTMKTEPAHHVMAFASAGPVVSTRNKPAGSSPDGIVPLDLSACLRLTDAVERTSSLPFGGTDCSLPMTYALANRWEVDTFIVLTDNETWAGKIHPTQALRKYREAMSLPAKLAVVGMTATGFSIADPSDAGMLDFVGFDAAAPGLLADFSRGTVDPSPNAGSLND
jgi:60 kDa SS-A/Ro ribonucleoprotein